MTRPLIDLRLYFVTDPVLCAGYGLVETVLAAVQGGATVIQLRNPHAKGRVMLEEARALVAALAPTSVPLIVNDRPDIALASGAAGVHVGQDDVPVEVARAVLGDDAVVGLSITDPAQLAQVPWGLVDHLGAGPVFGPGVKSDAADAIGIGGLADVVRGSRCPVVAIGAVSAERVADCFRAGVEGVAVVSAIAGQPDPGQATRRLRALVDAALAERSATR